MVASLVALSVVACDESETPAAQRAALRTEHDGGAIDADVAGTRSASRAFRRTAEGHELDTAESEVRFVVDGAALYLVRGEERTLVLEPSSFGRPEAVMSGGGSEPRSVQRASVGVGSKWPGATA